MHALRILFQRRRKMLTRFGALAVLGLTGMLAILPRADAHGTNVKHKVAMGSLLTPQPMSSAQFSAFFPLTHR